MPMALKDLSPNEKAVFHALVKYTSLNDRELSEQVAVKLSTVTAIKNRLKSRGYFMTVRVPQLQRLGSIEIAGHLSALSASSTHASTQSIRASAHACESSM